ncbi:hypothetical protein LEMLEM_LOCUS13735 [Lemmus lemmus]
MGNLYILQTLKFYNRRGSNSQIHRCLLQAFTDLHTCELGDGNT